MLKNFYSSLRRIFLGVAVCLYFAAVNAAAAPKEAPADFAAARGEYICALASLASYNNELNLFVRESLRDNGWNFVPLKDADDATAKMFLVKKDEGDGTITYLLAIAGTEDAKDVKTDLQLTRVPFPAGKTGANVPHVHRGFYDALDKVFLNIPRTEMGGLTVGEFLTQELKNTPQEKLYFTGHSLGGAMATLAAASLSENGVAPSQLNVITFGAPAVGDENFVETYKNKFGLQRIVTVRDPIEGVLQSVKEGYKQIGESTKRKNYAYGDRMAHMMTVYLDSAIRNYYDTARAANAPTSHVAPTAVKARAYIALPKLNLDANISPDAKYIQTILHDAFAARITSPVFATNAKEKPTEAMTRAKQQNCDYVIFNEVFGSSVKNNRQTCRLVMEETIYKRDGSLASMQSVSTLTSQMTPIEAVMYLYEQCRAEREKVLRGENGAN